MLDVAQQSFEEGIAAVGESDGQEQRVVDSRLFLVLLYNGGQLFVVADEDETFDLRSAEQSDDVGFEYLAGFVDNGERETGDVEEDVVIYSFVLVAEIVALASCIR